MNNLTPDEAATIRAYLALHFPWLEQEDEDVDACDVVSELCQIFETLTEVASAT